MNKQREISFIKDFNDGHGNRNNSRYISENESRNKRNQNLTLI